jgi:hypothetical protein
MTPQEFSRAVYGAAADAVAFNPVDGRLVITGSMTESGVRTPIHIVATDVTQFQWTGSIKEPDGFFELSTVEIRSQASGWLVAFEPWYTARLLFACQVLELNAEAVAGTGAWFQDSLDGPVAAAG